MESKSITFKMSLPIKGQLSKHLQTCLGSLCLTKSSKILVVIFCRNGVILFKVNFLGAGLKSIKIRIVLTRMKNKNHLPWFCSYKYQSIPCSRDHFQVGTSFKNNYTLIFHSIYSSSFQHCPVINVAPFRYYSEPFTL